MNKAYCKEPAFLRDIHRKQIKKYNKTKSMKLSERISLIVKNADKQIRKLGYVQVCEK